MVFSGECCCSLTLFMVIFTNEAFSYETNTQCWRQKTDVVRQKLICSQLYVHV